MNNHIATPNNRLQGHNFQYRWFFSLLFYILYFTLLYVQISVKATLSGQSPGVTGVTFSVLFQPAILFAEEGTEGQTATTVKFKVSLWSRKYPQHAASLVQGSIWEWLCIVLFPRERINLVSQMITQAFLHPWRGNAWHQIRPWNRQAWRQLLLSAGLLSGFVFS